MHQPARHDDDANLMLFGGIENERPGAQADVRDANRRRLCRALLRQSSGHETGGEDRE